MTPAGPLTIEPRTWTLAFCRTSPIWWVRLLARGKYKHVRAYACIPAAKGWLLYDVHLSGTTISFVPDTPESVRKVLGPFVEDCDLLSIRCQGPSRRLPLFGFCVPSIRHLIGLDSGALLPDTLWDDCIAAGGVANEPENADVHGAPAGPGAGDLASPDRQAAAGCNAG